MLLINSKKQALKKMGFFNDQDGIISRYTREKENWDIHLNKSKSFILKSANAVDKKSIAILGSGWLLDVPIDELAKDFKDVYLFDIRHPEQIKHKLRKYKNIHFIEKDLTGGIIHEIFNKLKNRGKTPPPLLPIETPLLQFDQEFDLTVSLNLLNQLDILIVEYIKQKSEYPDEDILAFRKAIQECHIEMLKTQKNACLISDCTESCRNSKDEAIKWEKPLVHCSLPKGKIEDSWIWPFDHTGNYYENKIVDFNVNARLF